MEITREIAQGFSFADINATFQCSSDMRENYFLKHGKDYHFNPETWNMGYYDDYIGTIQIFQLDEQNERTYGVELMGVFSKKYRTTNTMIMLM